jgi:hypothetical protein
VLYHNNCTHYININNRMDRENVSFCPRFREKILPGTGHKEDIMIWSKFLLLREVRVMISFTHSFLFNH